MNDTISFIKVTAAIGSVFGIGSLIAYIYNLIKSIRYKNPYTIYDTLSLFKEEGFKNSWRICVIIFLIFSMFAIVFTNAAAQELLGINDIEFKSSGTYCYLVKIENNKYEYVLPGQIRIENDSVEYEYGLETHTRHYTNYYIEKVHFSNGGYLYFNDFDVEPGIRATEYDQNGNEWICTLLNKHAYSPNIDETTHLSTKNICFLIFELASIIFAIVCLSCKKVNTRSENE